MNIYLAEVIGTMILIILGDGVVANVLLNKSKGQNFSYARFPTAATRVTSWLWGCSLPTRSHSELSL